MLTYEGCLSSCVVHCGVGGRSCAVVGYVWVGIMHVAEMHLADFYLASHSSGGGNFCLQVFGMSSVRELGVGFLRLSRPA